MVERIFISYRRDDSAGHAGRVYDRLRADFKDSALFMDVDAIPLGVNFVKVLQQEVGRASVLLAIIGPRWLDAVDEDGSRRLDNPDDFVRVEIAAALARGIPVVPILIEGARMPRASQLPTNLQELAQRNGLDVRHASFQDDMGRLVRGLRAMAAKPVVASVAPTLTVPAQSQPAARQAATENLDIPTLPDGTVGFTYEMDMPDFIKLRKQFGLPPSSAPATPTISSTDAKLGAWIRAQGQPPGLPPIPTADEVIAARGKWVQEHGIDLDAACPSIFSHLFMRVMIVPGASEYPPAGTIITGRTWETRVSPLWQVVHGYIRTERPDAIVSLRFLTYLGPTWRPEYAQLSDEVFKKLGGKPLARFIQHP